MERFAKVATQRTFLKNFLIFSYISRIGAFWPCISGSDFPGLKNEENPPLKSFFYFRKWNFLAPSLKTFLYFRGELRKSGKQKLFTLKILLVSYDVFAIYATVKHRKIPCEAKIQHRDITLQLHLEKQLRQEQLFMPLLRTSDENTNNNGRHKGS